MRALKIFTVIGSALAIAACGAESTGSGGSSGAGTGNTTAGATTGIATATAGGTGGATGAATGAATDGGTGGNATGGTATGGATGGGTGGMTTGGATGNGTGNATGSGTGGATGSTTGGSTGGATGSTTGSGTGGGTGTDGSIGKACTKQFIFDNTGDEIADAEAEGDFDANGNFTEYRIFVSGQVSVKLVWKYDANNNMIQSTSYAQSAMTRNQVNTFDANNNMIKAQIDSNGDGKWDFIYEGTYDANNLSTGYTYKSAIDDFKIYDATNVNTPDGDGFKQQSAEIAFERNTTSTYTYSANGEMVTAESDWQNDGTINYSSKGVVDADGKVTNWDIDTDGDGVKDQTAKATAHNAAGLATTVVFADAAGKTIETQMRTYDANGKMTSSSTIEGQTTTYKEKYTYNDAGKPLSWERDFDVDNVFEEIWTYNWDATGNLVSIEVNDSRNKDTPDLPEMVFTASAWDANGYATKGTVKYSTNDLVDREWTTEYDANGNITKRIAIDGEDKATPTAKTNSWLNSAKLTVKSEGDAYGDDTVDSIENSEYDANGNATKVTTDKNADGTINETMVQTFDAAGRLETYRSDDDGDGKWDFNLLSKGACQ